MVSELRKECIEKTEHWVSVLPECQDILEVGIAGDVKPGGNYELFSGKNYKTLDIDAQYEPDFVDDICNPKNTPVESFDVVILSNTIEHTYEPLEALKGAYKLLRKGGHLIVDCPWEYPYHAEDNFPDCYRISEDGMTYLLTKAGFEVVGIERNLCTSALAKK